MALMKRARPGGDLAAKAAEPVAVRTRIVASAATRTALRRPDRTRNVAPSYRDDAVSASNVGSVGRRDPAERGAADWGLRQRQVPVQPVTDVTSPPGRHRIGAEAGQGKG